MKKTFYITTAIDYVNAPPHLGHAYEKVIADVIARFHRLRGDETFFLTGTDEHGAKIARKASELGKSPETFVLEHREEFLDLLKALDISNDEFIYTSDKERHWPAVQAIWKLLRDRGDLYKSTYKGLYCVGHEAFITEKDLVYGICPDHQKKPEVIEEENYFFKLSKYKDTVLEAIESNALQIFPEARKREIVTFLKEGVEDISFSRPRKDIPWGVPVPDDDEHTIYVWADALPNYISVLGYGSDKEEMFKKFWPADIHLIGKDILRFHAVIWPAILLSAGLPLPKSIFVHGMILSGGVKMSKTIGNVIDPREMIEGYGAEAFRYFLMREIPFGEDGDFTKERFQSVYEGSLAHGLGNLVSRVAAMVQKYFPQGMEAPTPDDLISVPQKRHVRKEVEPESVALAHESLNSYYVREVEVVYTNAMQQLRLTEAISVLFDFYSLLDKYVQDYEPFKLVKYDEKKAGFVLWNLAWHIARSSHLLEPFMPHTALEMRRTFGLESFQECEHPVRIQVTKGVSLFPSKKKES